MRRRRLIRCFWIVAAVVAALEVVAFVVLLHSPRPLADSECSELYRRYSALPGIRASYVKNYQLNDTLFIDVTLIAATDDNGWEWIKRDFGIQKYGETDSDLEAWLNKKGQAAKEFDRDLINDDYLVAMKKHRLLFIFHIEELEQMDFILPIFLKKIKK